MFSLKSFSILVTAASAALAAQQNGMSERGVILSHKPDSSKYRIIVDRDGKEGEVPESFEFHTGDKFRVVLDLNQTSRYVYVLNRTLTGSPDKLKQSNRGVILSDGGGTANEVSASQEAQTIKQSGAKASAYQMVFQTKGKVSGKVTIPSNDTFEMDHNPGMEKLLVIVSQTPQNLRQLLKEASTREGQEKVRRELSSMAANSEVAAAPADRGFVWQAAPPTKEPTKTEPSKTEPSKQDGNGKTKPVPSNPPADGGSCAVFNPLQADKPYLVELSLLHR